jgi:pimeloyl-ACP methyl ester carboxylesterase
VELLILRPSTTFGVRCRRRHDNGLSQHEHLLDPSQILRRRPNRTLRKRQQFEVWGQLTATIDEGGIENIELGPSATTTTVTTSSSSFDDEAYDVSTTTSLQSLAPRRQRRPKPAMNSEDDIYRQIFNGWLPNSVQYVLRDVGFLRLLLNCITLVGLPSLIEQHPNLVDDALRLWFGLTVRPNSNSFLSSSSSLPRRQSIRYGDSPRQVIELWDQNASSTGAFNNTNNNTDDDETPIKDETIIFIHGGAWGTGFPAMYMLVALPFLEKRYSVAIIGYRTYPDASAMEQARDVADAIQAIRQQHASQNKNKQKKEIIEDDSKKSDHTYTLIAHSSGAHICALAMTHGILSTRKSTMASISTTAATSIDRFISLAGVFDIREHYKFEKLRGLARFSPMAPACSDIDAVRSIAKYEPANNVSIFKRWRYNSPLRILQVMTVAQATGTAGRLSNDDDDRTYYDGNYFPLPRVDDNTPTLPSKILLIHSLDDTSCPYWYTEDFATALQEYGNRSKAIINTMNKGKKEKDKSSVAIDNDDNDDTEPVVGDLDVDIEILESSGHQQLILELMFGGPVQDMILDWIGY